MTRLIIPAIVALLVATIITLPFGSGVAKAQYDLTVKDLKAIASWTAKAIKISQSFGEIINSTSQIDNISSRVLSGEIKNNLANRQFKNILTSILTKLNNARRAAKKLGVPPTVRDKLMERRMGASVEMLKLLDKSSKKIIDESVQLFIEAMGGDQSAANKLYEKSLRTYASILVLQNGLLSSQMATLHSNQANYYHYKGMIETYSALISFINALIPIYRNGSVDVEMIDSALMNIEVANSAYTIGRRVLRKNLKTYSAMRASSKKQKINKQISLKSIRSIYESFDVEDKIIILVREVLNRARKNNYEFDTVAFDNDIIELQILENKRAQIMLRRQEIVQGIQ